MYLAGGMYGNIQRVLYELCACFVEGIEKLLKKKKCTVWQKNKKKTNDIL